MTEGTEPGIYIETAGYDGNEDIVISIRNRNRSNIATKEYLDWRYIGNKATKQPIIFFVKSEDEKYVGMASIIFREYCISGKKTEIPILGDISIDKSLRGKGISKMLFIYINSYLEKEKYPFSFVLPNIPARKSLIKVNWRIEQEMVRYVFFLNPKVIFQKSKHKLLANIAGNMVAYLIMLFLLFYHDKKLKMCTPLTFKKTIDDFYNQWQNKHLITKHKSLEYLKWRYIEHPYDSFRIYEFFEMEKFIGYIVAKYKKMDDSLIIYELFLINEKNFEVMIKDFLYQCSRMKKICSVRITLNKNNPYRQKLKKAFFIERHTDNVFQTYGLRSEFSELKWLITSGDKDV